MQNILEQPASRHIGVLELGWQHRRKMAAVWLVGIVCTLAYFSLSARKYRSEAKVFVRIGRETVALDPTATTGQFLGVPDSRGSEVYAVEELLTSRPLAEKIVDQFGPYVILERDPNRSGQSLGQRLSWLDDYNLNPLRVYSLRDKALKAFSENLRVASGGKTNIVSMTYECESSQLAHDVLESLLKSACDEHLRVHRTKGSHEFFVGQSELLQSNLGQLSNQFRDLKNTTGVSSLASQREIKLQLIGSLQADLVRARTEQDAVEAELKRRQKQLGDIPALNVTERTIGQPHSTDQALREKLYDLEVKEQEFAAKLTALHPSLVEVRQQLAESRRIFQEEKAPIEVKTGINQTHKTAELAVQEREAQLVALTARTESLEQKIAAEQMELKQLNDTEVEVNRLEREIDLARANSRKYAENLEQARINQELEEAKISSLNLLQAPSVSETPVSPKVIPTLAVGLVVSVLSSFGVALLAHQRGRQVTSPASAHAATNGELSPNGSLASSFQRRGEGATVNPS